MLDKTRPTAMDAARSMESGTDENEWNDIYDVPTSVRLEILFTHRIIKNIRLLAQKFQLPQVLVKTICRDKIYILRDWKYNPDPDTLRLSKQDLDNLIAITEMVIEWKRRVLLQGLQMTNEALKLKADYLRKVFHCRNFQISRSWILKFEHLYQTKKFRRYPNETSLEFDRILEDIKWMFVPDTYLRLSNALKRIKQECARLCSDDYEFLEEDSKDIIPETRQEEEEEEELMQSAKTESHDDGHYSAVNIKSKLSSDFVDVNQLDDSSSNVANVCIKPETSRDKKRNYISEQVEDTAYKSSNSQEEEAENTINCADNDIYCNYEVVLDNTTVHETLRTELDAIEIAVSEDNYDHIENTSVDDVPEESTKPIIKPKRKPRTRNPVISLRTGQVRIQYPPVRHQPNFSFSQSACNEDDDGDGDDDEKAQSAKKKPKRRTKTAKRQDTEAATSFSSGNQKHNEVGAQPKNSKNSAANQRKCSNYSKKLLESQQQHSDEIDVGHDQIYKNAISDHHYEDFSHEHSYKDSEIEPHEGSKRRTTQRQGKKTQMLVNVLKKNSSGIGLIRAGNGTDYNRNASTAKVENRNQDFHANAVEFYEGEDFNDGKIRLRQSDLEADSNSETELKDEAEEPEQIYETASELETVSEHSMDPDKNADAYVDYEAADESEVEESMSSILIFNGIDEAVLPDGAARVTLHQYRNIDRELVEESLDTAEGLEEEFAEQFEQSEINDESEMYLGHDVFEPENKETYDENYDCVDEDRLETTDEHTDGIFIETNLKRKRKATKKGSSKAEPSSKKQTKKRRIVERVRSKLGDSTPETQNDSVEKPRRKRNRLNCPVLLRTDKIRVSVGPVKISKFTSPSK